MDGIQIPALEALQRIDDPVVISFLRDELCPDGMALVPTGTFAMGIGEESHTIRLPSYLIQLHLVTNRDFSEFVYQGGYEDPAYWSSVGWSIQIERAWGQPARWGKLDEIGPDFPVVGISWYEAVAYSSWLTQRTGLPHRLPTEAEWEKAARGSDGRLYPWVGDWDPAKCNTAESGFGALTPTGFFSPQGDSPFGVADMAGNAWEWCNSLYRDLPYEAENGREDLESQAPRVVRGGSFNFHSNAATTIYRDGDHPASRPDDVGFRCCISAIHSQR